MIKDSFMAWAEYYTFINPNLLNGRRGGLGDILVIGYHSRIHGLHLGLVLFHKRSSKENAFGEALVNYKVYVIIQIWQKV